MSEQSESLVPAARACVVLVTSVMLGWWLSACGQKGPLMLTAKPKASVLAPAEPRAAVAPAPAALPASAPPPRTWGSPPP